MIAFTKAHAYGNDFLYVPLAAPVDAGTWARRLCDRHRGVGADGLIFYTPTPLGAAMTLFNADGSKSELSGNGLRGLAAIVAFAVVPLMDRYSRRAMLRFECGTLVVATLISALAPTYEWLTIGRGIAGIGGAFIFGVCMAAAGDLFADPVERNRRIGIVASAASVAIIAGQPVLTRVV